MNIWGLKKRIRKLKIEMKKSKYGNSKIERKILTNKHLIEKLRSKRK
jgi:hypothetical protein